MWVRFRNYCEYERRKTMINNRNFEGPYCQTNQNKTLWWIMPASLFNNDVNYIYVYHPKLCCFQAAY